MTSQCSSIMDTEACISTASFEVKSEPDVLCDHCVIDRLFRQPFRKLPFEEKCKIISDGQPRPTLHVTTQLKSCVRRFNRNIYKSDHWICGCEVLNKLFCWPCLLFSREKNLWNDSGFSDLNNIYKSSRRHKDSANHIKCEKELHLFRRGPRIEFCLSEQDRISIEQHNETVKQNREILGRLISAACFLGKQGLAFRGHNESNSSNNKGNYMELLNEFARIDGALKPHLENSTFFHGTSSVQNDLIFSIAEVITATIKKEVLETPFVALIFESSDVAIESQMSTILRYATKEGFIVERFIAFSNPNYDKSTNCLLQNYLQIMNDFKCGSKLIAQTYDGAAVMASEHNSFQAQIRSHFNSAVFVHCYAHKLNLVLSQSVSFIKEVKLFFINIAGFSMFFSKSSNRIHALDLIVKKRLPSMSSIQWNFQSSLVETVNTHKVDFETLFETILENKDSEWDTYSVVCAGGLLNMLRDFDFNFFLMLFSAIFPHSDILFNVFQKKISHTGFYNKQIQTFVKYIENLRNDFENFWREMDLFVSKNGLPSNKSQKIPGEDIKTYKHMYNEILDCIILNARQRFFEHTKLNFMVLLECSNFHAFSDSFPDEILKSLQESYGQYFDLLHLKGELSVVYKDKDMRKKNVIELYQYITSLNLFSIFPETTKLIQLVTAIPVTSVTAENSFSCLERIRSYLCNSQGEERLSELALMHIENGLLERLRSTPQFQEDVIEVFIQKTQRTDLQFKK